MVEGCSTSGLEDTVLVPDDDGAPQISTSGSETDSSEGHFPSSVFGSVVTAVGRLTWRVSLRLRPVRLYLDSPCVTLRLGGAIRCPT